MQDHQLISTNAEQQAYERGIHAEVIEQHRSEFYPVEIVAHSLRAGRLEATVRR